MLSFDGPYFYYYYYYFIALHTLRGLDRNELAVMESLTAFSGNFLQLLLVLNGDEMAK